jgi:hypothetical protein
MISSQLRRPGRAAGLLAAGVFLAALAMPAGAGHASAAAGPALRRVELAGYHFEVPRSWPVIDLARHPRACVRFDRRAVYLGTPGADQSCPAGLVGTTTALLISPGPANSAVSSVQDPVTGQVSVRAPRITITATTGADPGLISQILASAGLPQPRAQAPRTARVPGRAAALPFDVTDYHGFGFDSCATPSAADMRAWLRYSRYRAVGIFIGGAEMTCAQPNLTRRWLRQQAAAGWHLMPLYAGPQAAYGELVAPDRQATAAADDAAAQAERLGFAPWTPLYYDMEGYFGQAAAQVQFFSAWTIRLHQLSYRSGIYSSADSGISDLARYYFCGSYAMPDVIYVGHWDDIPTTIDPVIRHRWLHHRRIHQYNGDLNQTYGGDTINIDEDYLDVELPAQYVPAVQASTLSRPDRRCPKR